MSASVAILASLAGIGFANAGKLTGRHRGPASAVVFEGRIAQADGAAVPAVSVACSPEIERVAVAFAGSTYTVTFLPEAPRGLHLFCTATAAGYVAAPVEVLGPTTTGAEAGTAPLITFSPTVP